jgi:hypothetical protein
VKIDGQAISEMDGRRIVAVVPLSEVVSMKVVLGSDVKHPALLLLLGAVLVVLGLYPFLNLFNWLVQGGVLFTGQVWLVVWLFLGVYAFYEVLKKVPIVLIETKGGTRKFAFRGKVEPQELQEFIQRVKAEFGHTIDSDL